MKIAVIGAGITGLAAAYQLKKDNHQVEVFEASHEIGGIAGTTHMDGMAIEKYYHHFFKSDTYIMELIKDLGLEDKILWKNSQMGFFSGGKLFDFGTPISLLNFKPLSLTDKLRFGATILKIMSIRDWKPLEKVSAHQWLLENAGPNVYETVWKPLLTTKFGQLYKDISMAWFWGKIKLRGSSKENGKEVLGYIDGSVVTLLDRLEEEIGAENIHKDCLVDRIEKSHSGFEIYSKASRKTFDRVLCSTPLPVFLKLCENLLPEQYKEEKGQIFYTAATCTILVLDKSFTKYYWLNIGDEEIPFGGLIEHTNMLDKKDYNNNHILYISNYVYKDSKYYNMTEEELIEDYTTHLKKINPAFNKSWIKASYTFKDEFAQPVIKLNYSKIKPDFETPVKGLYTATMCNIYPEDRGVNYAVRDGIKAAKTAQQ